MFGCLGPPTSPRGDGGPRLGTSRDGRSGYDLGPGLTGCDGGIDERPREDGYFASLYPPFCGKTEVNAGTRLARRPSRTPIGTPVRWERAVNREARAAVSFCILDNWIF
jgi:hypothetical protein